MTPEEWESWELREQEALAERQATKDAKRQSARERDAVAWSAIVLTPFLGAVVGAEIGNALAPHPKDFLGLGGIGWAIDGGIIGFCVGLLLGVIVALAIWRRGSRSEGRS